MEHYIERMKQIWFQRRLNSVCTFLLFLSVNCDSVHRALVECWICKFRYVLIFVFISLSQKLYDFRSYSYCMLCYWQRKQTYPQMKNKFICKHFTLLFSFEKGCVKLMLDSLSILMVKIWTRLYLITRIYSKFRDLCCVTGVKLQPFCNKHYFCHSTRYFI
jgi:hypothetical protein